MSKFLIIAVAFAAAFPCPAHHSLAADYDVSKPVLVEGIVTRVDWMNPHVRFAMDVKDKTGRVANWQFELGSPNTLMKSGFNRNSLKVGEAITVRACRAKDSATEGNATAISTRDGKAILARAVDGQNLVAR